MATCAGNVEKPEISNRGRWLNKVSPKLSPTELNLLILSFISEIPLGKLDKLVNASDLYSTLSDGCGFTRDEALQLLLRRMHLLGGNGRVCALEAPGFGIQHQDSNEALDHKLSEESVLMECVVQTYRELPVVKQAQLTKYLAEYLKEHPDNLSSFEVFSKLLYRDLLTPTKTEVLVEGLRKVNATTAAFKHLNDYYRQKGLQEISIPQDLSPPNTPDHATLEVHQHHRGGSQNPLVSHNYPGSPQDLSRNCSVQIQEEPNKESEKQPLLSNRRQHKCYKPLVSFITFIGLVLAVAVITVTVLHSKTYSETHLIVSDTTISLMKVCGFWHHSVWIVDAPQDQEDHVLASLYLVPLHGVKPYNMPPETKHFGPKNFLGPYRDMEFPYLYLLKHSKLHFHICLQNIGTIQPHTQFFLFKSKNAFFDFIDSKNNGYKTAEKFWDLPVGRNITCTNFTFETTSNAFYFMSTAVLNPAHLTVEVLFTINPLKLLNHSDYHIHCNVTGENGCLVHFGTSFPTATCYYILAHAAPGSQSDRDVSHYKGTVYYHLGAIILNVVLFSFVMVIIMIFCIIWYYIRRRHVNQSRYNAHN